MLTSLIVTTYNRPDALHLVLQSVLQQTILPDEIVIADDGSREDTRIMLEAFRMKCPIPLIHAWQEDLGFRAARVRNLAAGKANGSYLIFIDGDMILHPRFVASHLSNTQQGVFLHGKRAMLSDRRTTMVLRKQQVNISPFTPGLSLRSRAFHSEFLAKWLSHESNDWYGTQSANLSLWKTDFEAVNGFNEDFEGWGREDSELAYRLIQSGMKKFELRFCAITFHLSHGKNHKIKYQDSTEQNQKLLERTINDRIVKCPNGLSNHL